MVLYVVDVPPGGEDALTLRARRVLDEAVLVLAGREVRDRLARAGGAGGAPLLSPRDAVLEEAVAVVRAALAAGDVAWAAPDLARWTAHEHALLRALLAAGIKMLPVPGGSGWMACLVASGLPGDRFAYLGEMPTDAETRRTALQRAAGERHTLICRVPASVLPEALDDAVALFGDRAAALCGVCGPVWRGRLADVPRDQLDAYLVVEGAGEEQPWTEDQVRAHVQQCLAGGASTRDAARAVAVVARWPRRRVYQILLDIQSGRQE
jgi:16S rRNA (cytidine1402-2'-O)-methyltransferase